MVMGRAPRSVLFLSCVILGGWLTKWERGLLEVVVLIYFILVALTVMLALSEHQYFVG